MALLLAVAAPAAATRGQPTLAVPFHLQMSGVDRPLQMAPGVPPFLDRSTFGGRCSVASDWITTVDSTGVAAHLGLVSVTSSHCTRFDFFAPSPSLSVFDSGRMVVSGANGDELWISYSGTFLFYQGATPDVGLSIATFSTMTIEGGTGRFAGASGSLTGSATDNFPAGPNITTLSGTIVYDASARAHA
jgi:hypothetical protein